jgi:hypothetical protein
MMKFITRAVVYSVSILSSYLITGAIEERVLTETERFRPLTATLIGMGVIMLIFVPVFSYADKITQAAVKASLQQTKAGAGKVFGVIAFVVVVYVVLIALFLDRWFSISLLDAL